jgi:uridine kinase
VILEGPLIFFQPEIRNIINLKLYLDTDEDIRLSRRVYKDVCIKKKKLEVVIDKYLK